MKKKYIIILLLITLGILVTKIYYGYEHEKKLKEYYYKEYVKLIKESQYEEKT